MKKSENLFFRMNIQRRRSIGNFSTFLGVFLLMLLCVGCFNFLIHSNQFLKQCSVFWLCSPFARLSFTYCKRLSLKYWINVIGYKSTNEESERSENHVNRMNEKNAPIETRNEKQNVFVRMNLEHVAEWCMYSTKVV